jgi:hypothetical protein
MDSVTHVIDDIPGYHPHHHCEGIDILRRLLLAKVELKLPVAEMERIASAAERIKLDWHIALHRMERVAEIGAREKVMAELALWEASPIPGQEAIEIRRN